MGPCWLLVSKKSCRLIEIDFENSVEASFATVRELLAKKN